MTDSKTLRDWRAHRSGGRITVYGTNTATNQPDKIANVDEITPAADQLLHALAVDKNAVEHRLLFA